MPLEHWKTRRHTVNAENLDAKLDALPPHEDDDLRLRFTPRAGLLILVVIAAFIVFVFAGCGGPSEAEKHQAALEKYAQQVNDAQDNHGARIADLASPTPTKATLTKQAGELAALRRDLNAIDKVPAEARAAHDQLEAALADAEQAVRGEQDLAVAIEQVRGAITTLNGRLK